MSKKPRQSALVREGKRPRREVAPCALDEAPSWRISWMRTDGLWGWRNIPPVDWEEIWQRLAAFEQSSWSELTGRQSRLVHRIPVDRLGGAAQKELRRIQRDDVDELIEFRINKKGRVWGVPLGGLVALLWWDPEHEVYPMNPTDN